MYKKHLLIISLFIWQLFLFGLPSSAKAYYALEGPDCIEAGMISDAEITSRYIEGSGEPVKIILKGVKPSAEYRIKIRRYAGLTKEDVETGYSGSLLLVPPDDPNTPVLENTADFTIENVTDDMFYTMDYDNQVRGVYLSKTSEHVIDLFAGEGYRCTVKTDKIVVEPMDVTCTGPVTISQNRDGKMCLYKPDTPNACIEDDDMYDMIPSFVDFKVEGFRDSFGSALTGKIQVIFSRGIGYDEEPSLSNGAASFSHEFQDTGMYDMSYNYDAGIGDGWIEGIRGCNYTFEIRGDCNADQCFEVDPADPPPSYDLQDPGLRRNRVVDGKINFELCSQVTAATEGTCTSCLSSGGVWTAVGCIKAQPQPIIEAVIKMGVGLGGGVAILMTLVGGFLLTTSQGNPKQADQAKEMITSAVIGLLFVIFSVVILQFIGVTIMQIPGFGEPPTNP